MLKYIVLLTLLVSSVACSKLKNSESTQVVKEETLSSERAKEIVAIAQSTLASKLMGTMQKEGSSGAINFCSENALPLTDSLSKHFGITLTRMSDKPRNPKNKLTPRWSEPFSKFSSSIEQGEIPPVMSTNNEFAFPIITMNKCLACHGEPEKDIDEETLKLLDTKYPEDKARGYSINQLRGIWVVSQP